MDGTQTISQDNNFSPHEPEAARLSRIQRETAIIARAEADIAAGLGLGGDDVEAWLRALDIDANTPMPGPRGQSAASRYAAPA
ncbi:MAG: hypothetical protein P4L66_02075 [Acetobacteraceae bacterium]|nr:hypothetical protein [Acetobacteraceae bacterium]